MPLADAIDRLDWDGIGAQLDREGHARVPRLLDAPPPPPLVAALRAGFYRHLVPVANRWNAMLDMPQRYPARLETLAGQGTGPSPLYRLHAGEYQPLHRHGEGAPVFPLQLVGLLSTPGTDFTGGEFVMTEQRPRMQSRPMVVPLQCGDLAIVAVDQRPCIGARGIYRARLRHAVGRVRSGMRLGLEILFPDAVPG